MKRQHIASMVIASAASIFVVGVTLAAQDKYTVQVPGGLAFSEFRGYEDLQTVQGDSVLTARSNMMYVEAGLAATSCRQPGELNRPGRLSASVRPEKGSR